MDTTLKQSDLLLRKTYNKYLFPTALSVLGGTINVFFDGILVGQRLGEAGLVAVNLCLPVYLFMCTLGSLVSSGAAMKSSYRIGQNDKAASDNNFSIAVILMALTSLAFTLIGAVGINGLTKLLTGNSSYFDMVKTYTLITVLGTVPKMMLYIPFYYLRIDGKNRFAAFVMTLMMVTNIILDYVFLFVFDLGIGGAAAASVLATLIACFVGFVPFVFGKTIFDFTFKIKNVKKEALDTFKMGSPAAINNLMSAFRIFALNAIMLFVGGETLLSVFAVVNNMSEFSLCIINGVPQTATPIIGIYTGEKNNIGTRIIMKEQLISGLIAIFVFGAVMTCTPSYIGAAFGIEENILIPILMLSVSLLFALVNNIMANYFNCTKHIMISNIINFGRVLVFSAGAAYLFGALGGQSHIWWFLPIGEFATLIFWMLSAVLVSDAKKILAKILLENEKFIESQRVIDFSVNSTDEEICNASDKISEFCDANDMMPKQSYTIRLAIEECMVLMSKKCFAEGEISSFDVRVYITDGEVGMRLRCAGNTFNPIEYVSDSDEDGEYMGIALISKIAKDVVYQRTFGINCLLVTL